MVRTKVTWRSFGICQSFQGLLNFSISFFKEILNWSYDVAKSLNSPQNLADTSFLLLCRLWRLTSLLLTNTRNQSSWSGDRNSRKRLPSWRRTSNTTRTASTPWWWSVKGQYTGSKVKVKDKNLWRFNMQNSEQYSMHNMWMCSRYIERLTDKSVKLKKIWGQRSRTTVDYKIFIKFRTYGILRE